MSPTLTFAEALYNQLESLPTWTVHQARLARAVASGNLAAQGFTAHLEQTVRAKLGFTPSDPVDWCALTSGNSGNKTAINWTALLAFIEAILPIILPIILPLI